MEVAFQILHGIIIKSMHRIFQNNFIVNKRFENFFGFREQGGLAEGHGSFAVCNHCTSCLISQSYSTTTK
jgi:hypothetical protein